MLHLLKHIPLERAESRVLLTKRIGVYDGIGPNYGTFRYCQSLRLWQQFIESKSHDTLSKQVWVPPDEPYLLRVGISCIFVRAHRQSYCGPNQFDDSEFTLNRETSRFVNLLCIRLPDLPSSAADYQTSLGLAASSIYEQNSE